MPVFAHKKPRHRNIGKERKEVTFRTDRYMLQLPSRWMSMEKLPTLTFNLHQEFASAQQHVRFCLCIQRESLYTRGLVWLWRSNRIASAIYTVCPWLPGCDMNMEEGEQKAQWHWDKVIGVDRCVCEKLHLCVSSLCQDSRWPVAGRQWPSPYPSLSSTFFVHFTPFPKSLFISSDDARDTFRWRWARTHVQVVYS